MVTPALVTMFRNRGIIPISLDDGAAHFVNECQGRGASEIIVAGAGEPDAFLANNPTGCRRFEIAVSAASHPYLYSHQIQDVPVLPMVLVQEWFVRAARVIVTDAGFVTCRDLQLLKSVRLERFENGERFIVQLEEREGEADRRYFVLALLDLAGRQLYSASIETQRQGPPPPVAYPPTWTEVHPVHQLYGSRLFHGPKFAALQGVSSLGEDVAATLIGTLDLSWPGGPWQTDPALIDGGMQLALLWGYERLGELTLPTRVSEFVSYVAGPLTTSGPIRCVLKGRLVGSTGTRTELTFISDDSRVLAELHGLEMHMALL